MKNLIKALSYLFILNLILLFGCDESNITSSSIDSTSVDLNHAMLQSSDWDAGFISGPSETTDHAPQLNNETDGVLYHTKNYIQVGFQPLYDSSTSNLIYSARPPSVVDNYMAYTPSGSNTIKFGVINLNNSTVQTSVVPGAYSSTGPAIVKYQGNLYIFHKGNATNTIYSIKSTNGGSSWGTDFAISGTNTNTVPSATVFNNRIYLFYKGPTSNNIYYRYMSSNGNWSSEFSLPSSQSRTPSTPTVRTNSDENKLYLVYRGEDNYVFYRTMNTSGNWTSQMIAKEPDSSGPKTNSAPDIYFTDEYTQITIREKNSSRLVGIIKYN